MRSTPGRPHPLITPLSYRGWKSVVCRNSVSPWGFYHSMAKNRLFPCRQRVSRGAAVPRIGGPPGSPKSVKKRYGKPVLKKRSQNRFWGAHGEPQGAPGSPNEAKMEAKRLQKRSPKRHCLRLGWENGKCNENILFATL